MRVPVARRPRAKARGSRAVRCVTADVLRGAFVDPAAGKVTFADFAERWLEAQTLTESTREATELRLRIHAVRSLGPWELRAIKPSVIQAWVRGLQNDLAPTYVRTVSTNVSAVMNAAVDDGLIASNPCRARSVRLPPRVQRKVQPWSSEQVSAVIDAMPPRYRAVAVVAAGCGLRQGEAFGLRVCDLDFLHQQLRVEQQIKILRSQLVVDRPKGGKTRTVPLAQSVAFELAEHLRRYPATGEGPRLPEPRAEAPQPQLLQPRDSGSRPLPRSASRPGAATGCTRSVTSTPRC